MTKYVFWIESSLPRWSPRYREVVYAEVFEGKDREDVEYRANLVFEEVFNTFRHFNPIKKILEYDKFRERYPDQMRFVREVDIPAKEE